MNPSKTALITPLRLSTLLFIQNEKDEFLLLERKRPPNQGLWSPPGGKLEMDQGESPFECARREAMEETGLIIEDKDLHLFSMVTEKAYEGKNHWLLFLFHCKKRLSTLPEPIAEGHFAFFSRNALESIAIPLMDKTTLWPIFDRYHNRFACLRANFNSPQNPEITVETIL